MVSNSSLCDKLGISGPSPAIHLRLKITVVDNRTSGKKYEYLTKVAVLPRDTERFAHELVLINGTLEDVRVFHIMDLLGAAAAYFGSDEADLPLTRPENRCCRADGRKCFTFNRSAHPPAVIAYVVRYFCSEWTPTEVWGTSDQGVREALGPLHSVEFDKDCFDFSHGILSNFMNRWATKDCLDTWGCSDPGGWASPERLTLSACPNIRPTMNNRRPSPQTQETLFYAPPSNCNRLVERDADKQAKKHELVRFCELLSCRNRLSECPEAYAVITKVTRYRDLRSPVKHEIFMVTATMGEEELWVRLDRSRQGKQVEPLVWEAFDTVSCEIAPNGEDL